MVYLLVINFGVDNLSLSTSLTQFPRTASAATVNPGCLIGRLLAIPAALSSAHWPSSPSSVPSAVEGVESKNPERRRLGVGRG